MSERCIRIENHVAFDNRFEGIYGAKFEGTGWYYKDGRKRDDGPTYVWIGSKEHFAKVFPKPSPDASFEEPGHYNAATGYRRQIDQHEELFTPMVIRDVPEHQHPSGKWISSRSHQREEAKKTGKIPWERVNPKREKGFTNEAFCKKRGLKPSDKARAYLDGEMQSKRAKLKPQTLNGVPLHKLVFKDGKGL